MICLTSDPPVVDCCPYNSAVGLKKQQHHCLFEHLQDVVRGRASQECVVCVFCVPAATQLGFRLSVIAKESSELIVTVLLTDFNKQSVQWTSLQRVDISLHRFLQKWGITRSISHALALRNQVWHIHSIYRSRSMHPRCVLAAVGIRKGACCITSHKCDTQDKSARYEAQIQHTAFGTHPQGTRAPLHYLSAAARQCRYQGTPMTTTTTTTLLIPASSSRAWCALADTLCTQKRGE